MTDNLKKTLRDAMLSCGSHIDLPVNHRFINDVCPWIFYSLRCIGCWSIHKTEHISIISQGALEVVTDNVITGEVLRRKSIKLLVLLFPCWHKTHGSSRRKIRYGQLYTSMMAKTPPKTSKYFTWLTIRRMRRSYWLLYPIK